MDAHKDHTRWQVIEKKIGVRKVQQTVMREEQYQYQVPAVFQHVCVTVCSLCVSLYVPLSVSLHVPSVYVLRCVLMYVHTCVLECVLT